MKIEKPKRSQDMAIDLIQYMDAMDELIDAHNEGKPDLSQHNPYIVNCKCPTCSDRDQRKRIANQEKENEELVKENCTLRDICNYELYKEAKKQIADLEAALKQKEELNQYLKEPPK